ncbi:MAG: TrbC/VirB2 family protein [Desulfobulbus sp.]|jgi:type IV secretory pathway VirB2 component (pilin)
MKTDKQHLLWLSLVVLVAVAALLPEQVLASGGLDEFSGPFEKIVNTITGKWGQLISVAGMAVCGVIFIFNRQDLGEGFKMLLQVVFGICFIAFAASIVTAMFSFSGAVI